MVAYRALCELRTSTVGARSRVVLTACIDSVAFARRSNVPERRLGYFNAGTLLLEIAPIRNQDLFTSAYAFLASCR